MARSAARIDDEQKSYGAVFLLGVAMLLAGAVWAFWDDQISRRPWKRIQWEFFRLEKERAQETLKKEEERLAKDPAFVDLQKKIAAATAQLESGPTRARLRELEARRARLQLKVDEEDLNLRIKKSEIEEAWYAVEHAVLTRHDDSAPRARLRELEEAKGEVEKRLADAQAAVAKIDGEIGEIRTVVKDLERQLREVTTERERMVQKLDAMKYQMGLFVTLPRIPKIQQVVLHEFDRNRFDQPVARVDRCMSCHMGMEKAEFENDPNPHKAHPRRKEIFGKHPPEKFGCTPCHQGQGAAVNSVEKAHGEVKFWEHPLLRGELAQSTCISCHADVRLPGAERIATGEDLFVNLGCHGCHLVNGYGDLEKVGPSLRRIAAKADAGWLVRWVKNPHEFRPHTKMPNFLFKDDKPAVAIAAYLLDASKKDGEAWLGEHGEPAGVDPNDAEKVARGKELVDSVGCRGCHGIADGESPAKLGKDKDIAPNLAGIAEKADARWIYHWIKNPRGYSPVARMPNLRLSDDEAAAITSFLLTLGKRKPASPEVVAALGKPETVREGEKLVRKYGCAGCHDIPGMEGESRIGVELSTFGEKTLEELFFGNRTDIPVTWHDWTYNKLKTPRTYETERIEQVMPQFDLAHEDIEALLLFLHSRKSEEVPEQYRPATLEREQTLVRGRRVVEKYNCVGCHVIEGRGGAIRARYEENPTFAPPILTGEGMKVQPNWLFGFLKKPVVLRPWLKVRMPTFGLSDEETKALIDYFLALDHVEIPFSHTDPETIPAAHIEAGKTLTGPDYFNCFSCHQQGDRKPEGPQEGWAPDLALARERLNPQWVLQWLRDPQKLMPGTKMPSFYNFEDESPDGPEDVLGGDDAKQVEALRDYLMTLGSSPAQVMARAESRDGAN